jgi:arabinogalactan oligomer / maltooligosaccharide transport system permease protein
MAQTRVNPALRSQVQQQRRERQTGLTAAAYMTPALCAIAVVNVFPLLYSLYMSLTNRNGPRRFPLGQFEITGFDNYLTLLSRPTFYTVFVKSVIFALVCVAIFFVFGLALALLIEHPAIKGRAVWRTLLILPWAVPTWVTALVWRFMFNGQFGTINHLLRGMGLPAPDWLTDPFFAWVAIVVVNLWMSYPFFMLILIGGLTAIPSDLYEAASLDGAGFWQQLFRITIPLLRPVAVPALILSGISQFQMFNTVFLMTRGGPFTRVGEPGATELLLVWGYNQGFQGSMMYGLTSAFSIIVFLLLLTMTLGATRFTNATKGAYE